MLNTDKDIDNNETTRLIENIKHARKPKDAPVRIKAAVLVSAVAIQALINGLIFCMPVFYPELVAAFDAKRSDAVLVQSLFSGISTGGGLFWSPVIQRYGLGPCTFVSVVIGIVFFGINLVASSLIMVIVTVGIIAGLGISLCYLIPFISVSWTFHSDPGWALVIVTVGSSLGQFVFPYIVEVFMQQYQWRGTFLLCGALATQMIPFSLIIHNSRKYFNTGASQTTNKGRQSKCPIDLTLFKDVVIAIILSSCFLGALTGNLEAWFMVDILVSRGFERERGSLIVSLVGMAMFIGRIAGITIQFKCRNVPSVYHWIYIWPLVGISHAIVINLYDYYALVVMCIVTGSLFGTASSQTPAIMYEASGLERYPQGMALVNLMYGLGNFFAGLLGGFIRDAYGDYSPMFYLGLASGIYIALSPVAVACILRRRQRGKDLDTSVKYTKIDT